MFRKMMGARFGALELLRNADGAAGGGQTGASGAEAATLPTPAEGAAAGSAKWFEDQRLTEDHRGYLTAKGLTAVEDPMDVVSKLIGIGQAADRRFGKGIDSVLDKPGKDQPLVDWRKANAETFGLPQSADGYEIKRPEGVPDGVAWNQDLEGRMKTLAFERGMAPDDVQAMTEMYAGYVTELNGSIDAEMLQAEKQLDTELGRIWGRDVEANKTKARQAAAALAEASGLDQAGIESVVGLLSNGAAGQTLALRMFAALGDMMGDDRGIGLKSGIAGLGMTKAEAQQALSAFMAPEGDWAKASAAGDTEGIARLRPQFERLARQASAER